MKYFLIGLGVFGRALAHHLSQIGAEVIALDRRDDNVTAIKDEVCSALCAPFDDPIVLTRFPIADFDAVIVAIGDDFEASMAFTMKAQELGARRLVCRVLSPMHQRLLQLLKVDRIVVPEEFAARGLAHSLLLRGVVNGVDMGSGYALVEATASRAFLARNSQSRRELFEKHRVRLVTVKRQDTSLLARVLDRGPDPHLPLQTLGHVQMTDTFKDGDVLVMFGQDKDLRRCLEEAAD